MKAHFYLTTLLIPCFAFAQEQVPIINANFDAPVTAYYVATDPIGWKATPNEWEIFTERIGYTKMAAGTSKGKNYVGIYNDKALYQDLNAKFKKGTYTLTVSLANRLEQTCTSQAIFEIAKTDGTVLSSKSVNIKMQQNAFDTFQNFSTQYKADGSEQSKIRIILRNKEQNRMHVGHVRLTYTPPQATKRNPTSSSLISIDNVSICLNKNK